ncbi:MAG: GC-type dockerin domain-anchored protein [Phycisphaerales bacterium]
MRRTLSLSAALLAAAGSASAQCPQLSVVPGCGYNGVYPSAERMVLWDPDGPGPRPEVVLISGVEIAGERACNGFATWDGVNLEPLPGTWTEKTGDLVIWNGRPVCNSKPRASGPRSPDAGAFEYVAGEWRRLGPAGYVLQPGVLAIHQNAPVALRPTGTFASECVSWNGTEWIDFNPNSDADGSNLFAFGEQLWAWGGGVARRWGPTGWELMLDIYPSAIARMSSDGTRMLLYTSERFNGFNFSRAAVSPDGEQWTTVYSRTDSVWTIAGATLCGPDVVLSRGVSCRVTCFATSELVSAELASPAATLLGGSVSSGVQFQGERLVGGGVRSIDSTPAAGLLTVRDGAWSPLLPGVAGEARQVFVDDGSVSVALEHESGTMDTSTVRSNVSGEWQQIGESFPFAETPVGLFRHAGTLYMNTAYVDATGIRFKRWNGAAWEPVAPFGTALVKKIGVLGGQAVVTADAVYLFDGSVRTLLAPRGGAGVHKLLGTSLYAIDGGQVKRFESGAWRDLGTPFNATVASLALNNGRLTAVGGFVSNAGVHMAFASQWNGTAWRPVGTGLSPEPEASFVGAAASDEHAHAVFWFAGQNGLLQYRLYRIDPAGGFQRVATFSSDSIRSLIDGPDSIFILGEGLKDGRGGGGWLLRYGPGPNPCPADLDCTGAIDGDDIIAFFAAWESGAPNADVNGDAEVDGDDVTGFFAWWDVGC